MKKQLLFLTALLVTLQTQATHLMGGQITSRNLAGLTYEVTLTYYRDTTGINMMPVDIHYSNNSGYSYYKTILNPSSVVYFGNGVEKYLFIDTITFTSLGTYKIDVSNCCRNAAILNIQNPGGTSLYLDNVLLADSTNSSPTFLNDPVTIGQLWTPFLYNPLPYDIDGDSLAWVIDTPMNNEYFQVNGFFLPPSDSSMPFNLDPLTGEISFLPSVMGTFELSVKVIEYRNGIEIGYIRRDMQIIINNSPNIAPVVSTSYSILRQTSSPMIISPGQTFTFNVSVTDPNHQLTNFSVNGELSMISNPLSANTTITPNNINSTITWVPTSNNIRTQPYIFSFRISENYGAVTYSYDYSYVIKVETPTTTNEIKALKNLTLYPNPTIDKFSIECNEQNASLVLVNETGKAVLNQVIKYGTNTIDVSNLSQGIYYVITNGNNINRLIINK